ncbi:LytTR family transcriptional regulator DNA-binding domain-containing protein [Jeotgalibacillus proteolyticus]|uniref:LytTR family transcriptional regulator DNA-binding domain-containing protein n=1 Tax=Jeotgalibacillus proteolyticus TaxID=2082395 RepID=UPI003CF6224C
MIKIINAEKSSSDSVVFPPFSMEIHIHEAAAIHSSLNVRSVLMDIFSGGMSLSGGSIEISGNKLSSDLKNCKSRLSCMFLDDGLYERLTVTEQIVFWKNLHSSSRTSDETLRLVQLEHLKKKRISSLTFSEKRRVHFARLLLENKPVLILEEPDQNVDLETRRVIKKVTEALKEEGKSILLLTGNMESALFMTERVHRLDEKGLHQLDVKLEEDGSSEEEKPDREDYCVSQPVQIEKIPAKINEKIILFNPPEIDFVESSEGQSNLSVQGEVYPCTFTLNDLEKRLVPFGFFRCHRSYIVNLQKVREVVTWTRNSYSLVLEGTDRTTIPLSKSKMAELKEMLGLK